MVVVILSTGGTIASTSESGDEAAPTLDAEDIIDEVPEIDTVAPIRTRNFSNLPSPHIGIDRMNTLVTTLSELDADPEVDGVVVTHGTDSLEETALFADLCYTGDTTVVFTGAIRNPDLPSPDGPINVLGSVRVAAASDPPHNVFLVMNDRIHLPRTVTKANSMNVDTFRSPEFGPVGTIAEDRLAWRFRPVQTDKYDITPETLSSKVFAVTATAEMPPEQVTMATEGDGLCLAAMGAGHVPPEVVPALETVAEADVPIIITTRCYEGEIAESTYGFYGSERTLKEIGVYKSDLNLQKTRIKTIVALASNSLSDAFPYLSS
jgi:L-asparaginase